ncbi:MAG: DUF167 domain-containing protein [Patescibacteria group bacterium]|mgnify:CR=1 FL=1
MKIFVKAKPNAKEEKIEKINDNNFIISVKEPPVQGMANAAIIKALAEYLGINKNQLEIVVGYTNREKIIEIKPR